MSIFDGLEGPTRREPVRRQRSLAWGACPRCSAEKVGLIRTPDYRHFIWRDHNLRTHAGTSLPCRASGTYLCDQPARVIVGYDHPVCPHDERNQR